MADWDSFRYLNDSRRLSSALWIQTWCYVSVVCDGGQLDVECDGTEEIEEIGRQARSHLVRQRTSQDLVQQHQRPQLLRHLQPHHHGGHRVRHLEQKMLKRLIGLHYAEKCCRNRELRDFTSRICDVSLEEKVGRRSTIRVCVSQPLEVDI